MLFRSAIQNTPALGYMLERLKLRSPLGRRVLLSSKLITSTKTLEKALNEVEHVYNIQKSRSADVFDKLRIKLEQIRDIKGTLDNLANGSCLDDIELFEVKNFSILASDIKALLEKAKIEVVQLPELEEVVALLDPEGQRIPHFYIYDSYSKELAELRKQVKAEKAANNMAIADELYLCSIELEDSIRAELSASLQPHADKLHEALNSVAYVDILLAKSTLALEMGLCKPHISNDTVELKKLFNPHVKAALAEKGRNFQPVDITFTQGPCLITGANMSGKTVLLKTIALTQYLFQFGFFVPAEKASLVLVDEVMTSIEDGQEELKGLSSFAAEMLTLNEMLAKVNAGKRMLLLIDELARTTNPTEGQALVNAMLDILTQNKVKSIITTHYSGIVAPCKRLRVKGFVEDKATGGITKSNIEEYIDYSLVEDDGTEAPMEAIRVAGLLGVNDELLSKAKSYINQ